MSITLEQVLKAYKYADSHPHKYLRGTTNWCAAVAHALNVQQPAPVANGTTSDKYKAELYDEVWQKARDMGFNNVTDALAKVGAPVAAEHTMRSVMDAIQQARGFPVLTSNQCHALAESLNYVARLNGVKP